MRELFKVLCPGYSRQEYHWHMVTMTTEVWLLDGSKGSGHLMRARSWSGSWLYRSLTEEEWDAVRSGRNLRLQAVAPNQPARLSLCDLLAMIFRRR
jgi:hypothetical protein